MNLDMDARLREMKAKHPRIRLFTIGYSIWGKPLHALSVGGGPCKIMYSAAHHANEWLTAPLLTRFIGEYAEAVPSGVTLYAVPLVNPDGAEMVARGWITPEWKANARGVDLNANYPAGWRRAREIKKARGFDAPGPREYAGTRPLSEPESRAMAAFTAGERFDITVSLHTQGEEIYWRYGSSLPPGSRELAEAMASASGYALENAPEESAHAGYKDWFIQAFNKPGFTVECGLGENPLPAADFNKIYPGVAKMLNAVMRFPHGS